MSLFLWESGVWMGLSVRRAVKLKGEAGRNSFVNMQSLFLSCSRPYWSRHLYKGAQFLEFDMILLDI